MKLRYIEIEQPIGTFYLTSMPATALYDVVEVRPHGEDDSEGVQRELSERRANDIRDFCSDTDAVFPTPIVISIKQNVPYNIDTKNQIITLPDSMKVGEVIDGQHRLWGINRSPYKGCFELPVVLMFNLTLQEKAYIFSIVNKTQTKVNRSLIYNLFGLTTNRSPYKTAHEIARACNQNEASPFYRRLKMLGKKTPNQTSASLSQGTFVKQLVELISKNPEDDARRWKRGDKLIDIETLPLRKYFIEEQDNVIMKIIENCFSALKIVFPAEWNRPDNNILWKTTGFCGVMIALNNIVSKGIEKKSLTVEFFMTIFRRFKADIESNNIQLTSRDFPGGGGQNQKRLASLICDSANSIYSPTSGMQEYTDYKSFISDIISVMDDEEKYELGKALNGDVDTLHSFTSQENEEQNTRTVIYLLGNCFINIPIASVATCVHWYEENYLDGMDVDSWYSFKVEMEKDEV